MDKLTKYITATILIVFAWKTLVYFVGQRDHAVVYTKSCLQQEPETCLKFEGKLKYTYFSGDYIIINGDKEILINKDEVAAVSFSSVN